MLSGPAAEFFFEGRSAEYSLLFDSETPRSPRGRSPAHLAGTRHRRAARATGGVLNLDGNAHPHRAPAARLPAVGPYRTLPSSSHHYRSHAADAGHGANAHFNEGHGANAHFNEATSSIASLPAGCTSDEQGVDGLRNAVTNYELLRELLFLPVQKLRQASDEGKLDLAFLQSCVYAALMVNNQNVLAELAGIVREGRTGQTSLLSRVKVRQDDAATMLQNLWRAKHARGKVVALFRQRLAERAMAGRCLVLGAINLDLKGEVGHHPWPQEGTSVTDVGTFASAPGGKGANEAVAVAKLGVPVYLVGRVGEDELGVGVRENFARVNGGYMSGSGKLNVQGRRWSTRPHHTT